MRRVGGARYCYAPAETFVTASCNFGVVSPANGLSFLLLLDVGGAVAVVLVQVLVLVLVLVRVLTAVDGERSRAVRTCERA